MGAEQLSPGVILDRMLTSENQAQGRLAEGIFAATALCAAVVEIVGNGMEAVKNQVMNNEGQGQ